MMESEDAKTVWKVSRETWMLRNRVGRTRVKIDKTKERKTRRFDFVMAESLCWFPSIQLLTDEPIIVIFSFSVNGTNDIPRS